MASIRRRTMVGGKQEYCAAAVSLKRLNRRVPLNPTRVDARSSVGEARLPPTSELCTRHELRERHPHLNLMSDHRSLTASGAGQLMSALPRLDRFSQRFFIARHRELVRRDSRLAKQQST